MAKNFDTIIIGGGIIGLFSAYYLNKQGQSVAILDKGPSTHAASHGNCGLITPSHVLPLNEYGLIKKACSSLFKKDAPFFLKPQLNGLFIQWCYQFLRHSSKTRFHQNAIAIHKLLSSSKALYDKIIPLEKLDCNWCDDGIHFVFKTKKEFKAFEKTNELTKHFNIEARPFGSQELLEDEPSLRNDVYGSWFYDIDGWLRPDYLIRELKRILKETGVTFYEGSKVSNINHVNETITSIATIDELEFDAENYVIATGAWTPLLKQILGFRLPIIPGKGYSITMKCPHITPKRPIIMMEKSVVATPWKSGYRLGSTMELAGYNEKMNRTRLNALKQASKLYLKEPYTEEVYEEWSGLRPMTWDGVPVIAKSPQHKNLFVAAGHGMLGISMGPATGKLVCEQILGVQPHVDEALYQFK